MPPITQIKLPLVLKDRLILREGRWNGIFYPAEEIKPLVGILNDIPKAVREAEHDGRDVEAVKLRNATSLFWDHDEKCENWLGDVRNFRWDEKLRGIRGDLYLVDQEAARKVKYQEERGFTSWGLSPSVMVDKSRSTARNISFNNIAVVLEPAGGVQLMLSVNGPRETPSENGGRPMAKNKKKKDLDKDDDATKDEDTKKTDDEEKEEDSAKEKETPGDEASSEEEDLEDVDFEAEEGSEDEGEEELAASTDDIMAAVGKLTVIVGALAAAMKKGKGYGNPGDKKPEDEEEEQEDKGLAQLDREALLEIASKVTKEAKVLENEDELTESVLRDFLSRIASFLPGAEEMASDGDDDEDDDKEDKDADSKEDDEKKEEKKDDEKKEDGSDSESEEEEEEESDKGEKKDMAAIVKSEFARTRQDLRKEINKAVKAELSRRVRPQRKGQVTREKADLKKIEQKREDLQARLAKEPDAEKRLEIAIKESLGE